MGQYVTRTYKKFGKNADGWMAKALNDRKIMDDFAALERQENPQATDAEIRQLAEVLLRDKAGDLGSNGVKARSQKYTDVLKKRKNLPPALRQLYGERTDAFESYAESVSKLANLVAHRQFVDQLKQTGIEQGFFSTTEAMKHGHTQQVKHQKLAQLKGLEGVLMAPEIADSINDIYTVHTPVKAERVYLASMGLSKARCRTTIQACG